LPDVCSVGGKTPQIMLYLSDIKSFDAPLANPVFEVKDIAVSAKGNETQIPKEKVVPPAIHSPTPLLVFHINDSTDDQVLFQTACKHARVPFLWHVTDSTEKAISYLETLLKLDQTHAVRWPDLVVLDVAMPGESGFKVLQFIRATPQLRRLPVIIFTGHTTASLVEEAYKLGANSFLSKPTDFSQTVSMVASLYAAWSAAKRPML
jgi:two-component system response regulator